MNYCKNLLAIVSILGTMAVSEAKADNVLAIENIQAKSGSQVNLSVLMNNSDDITAFSFDLYLPDGILVSTHTDNKGKEVPDVTLTDRADDQTITTNYKDGYYSIAVLSLSSSSFGGNTGSVCDIKLNVAENVEDGEYEILINNIELTNPNNTIYNPDEITCTLSIAKDGDIYDEGYSLQLHPFKVINGQEYDVEAESGNLFFELQFQNSVSVSNLEFDIQLPDGVTIGSYLYNAGTPKKPNWIEVYDPYYAGDYSSEDIFPTAEDNEDGTIHVISEDAVFQPVSSLVSVISLPIAVDESVSEGIYNIEILNIVANGTINIAPYSTDIYIGNKPTASPSSNGMVAYHGNYNDGNAMALLNASLPTEGVTTIDLSAVTAVPDGVSIDTSKNPNALILTETDLGLGNDANVVIDGQCENLVLTDMQPFFNTKEFTANIASYSRTMENHHWGTLCLPFMAKTNTTAQVYNMTDVSSGGEGVMTVEETDAVTAYLPCIIKKLDGDVVTFTDNDVTIPATAANTMSTETGVQGWTLKGTMNALKFEISDQSLYFINSDCFWKAKNELTIAPFRAYFETSGSAPAKFRIEDGSNGIEEIMNDEKIDVNYDLQGRIVKATQSGQIYIQHANKFLVK